MMSLKDQRLHEISQYFQNGDDHLGYRRLLDAAIETRNNAVYENTLAFCDWYDTAKEQGTSINTELHERVQQLLQVIEKAYPTHLPDQHANCLSATGITKRFNRGVSLFLRFLWK